MRSEGGAFNVLFRFVMIPMTLFSGSFFPITEMPLAVRWLAWISPLWHGNELARGRRAGRSRFLAGASGTWPTWLVLLVVRPRRCPAVLSQRRLIV